MIGNRPVNILLWGEIPQWNRRNSPSEVKVNRLWLNVFICAFDREVLRQWKVSECQHLSIGENLR